MIDLDRANKSSKLDYLKVSEYSRLCADGVCLRNQQFLQPGGMPEDEAILFVHLNTKKTAA